MKKQLIEISTGIESVIEDKLLFLRELALSLNGISSSTFDSSDKETVAKAYAHWSDFNLLMTKYSNQPISKTNLYQTTEVELEKVGELIERVSSAINAPNTSGRVSIH